MRGRSRSLSELHESLLFDGAVSMQPGSVAVLVSTINASKSGISGRVREVQPKTDDNDQEVVIDLLLRGFCEHGMHDS